MGQDVRYTEEEVEIQDTDPTTGETYVCWADVTWDVHVTVERGYPATYYEPGEPGGIVVEDPRMVGVKVAIARDDIQNGIVQVGLDEILDDSHPNLVYIKPRPEHIRAAEASFNLEYAERAVAREEPEFDVDAAREFEAERRLDYDRERGYGRYSDF